MNDILLTIGTVTSTNINLSFKANRVTVYMRKINNKNQVGLEEMRDNVNTSFKICEVKW